MTLNLMKPSETEELRPRITVFGVGGAGGNAVNNMIAKRLQGVEFVVANTDAQALQQSDAHHKVQMGVRVTEGLGAGALLVRLAPLLGCGTLVLPHHLHAAAGGGLRGIDWSAGGPAGHHRSTPEHDHAGG